MVRSLRFATVGVFAVAVVSLTAASASAFTFETVKPPGDANSSFTDPDNHTNFGPGAQPLGPNGPTVQFGVQQGSAGSFNRFQGSGFNAPPPPDPYYGALNSRN